MGMREAYNWTKEAMSGKGLQPLQQFYLVKDGMITMTDGRMTASHPFPYDQTFCAAGEPTEKLLNRLPEPITIAVEEDHAVFRHKRLSGKIRTASAEDWEQLIRRPDAAKLPLPSRLLHGLRQLRPFISDNASRQWALCVLAANDTLYATNNIAVAAAPEIDLDDVRALIPNWAVDFVIAREEGLTHWSHGEGYLCFHWANGAWMRTQLVVDEFPTTVEEIIGRGGWAEHELTDDWREAYDHIASLSANVITLYSDRMTGFNNEKEGEATMAVTVEASSPVPDGQEYSRWDPRYLAPVMQVATHFDPQKYPNPCPFRGDGVVGVVVGRR